MLKLTKTQFFKILIVYALLALAAFCCFNINKFVAPAKKRSFQCHDQSLRKPFVYDTVSHRQLHLLGIYIPIILITVCELIFCSAYHKSVGTCSRVLGRKVLKISVLLTIFLIGLAIERLYKNVAKMKMGRLRPNFITVCNPVNQDGYTCQDSDYTATMEEYECNSEGYPTWAVSTAFSSFPSGHTSLVSYSMVFLIGYLHLFFSKLHHLKSSSAIFVLILQTCCFFTIIFVAVSRVLDFKHYWLDVCAGFIGGSSIALIMNYYLKTQQENIKVWLNSILSHNVEDIKFDDKGDTSTTTCAIEMVAK